MASANRLLRVFLDVSMQKGHRGLTDVASKHGVVVAKLRAGEHVVFVNRRVNRMKIYSANNIIAYLAHEHGKLDLGALQWFAESFGADGFEYTHALKKVLLERLPDRGLRA